MGLVQEKEMDQLMAIFRFKVGPITSTGKTVIASDKMIVSIAQCPFCYKKYTAKKNPGQSRTIEHMESSVRGMIGKHYNKEHGGIDG